MSSWDRKRSPKLKMLWPLCNQQLIQRQKSHEQDIIPKNHLQIDRSNYFASLGIFMHQGRRTQRKQNHVDRLSKTNKMNSFILLKMNKKVRDNYSWLLCIGSDNPKRGWLKKSIIMNTCKVEQSVLPKLDHLQTAWMPLLQHLVGHITGQLAVMKTEAHSGVTYGKGFDWHLVE